MLFSVYFACLHACIAQTGPAGVVGGGMLVGVVVVIINAKLTYGLWQISISVLIIMPENFIRVL